MAVSDPYRVLQVLPDAEQAVIKAAFRALALQYHPDRDASPEAVRRMAQLNEAYAMVGSPGARAEHDRAHRRAGYGFAPADSAAATSSGFPPPHSSSAGTRLDAGRYNGWTLRDLARHDPDYLRWLSRHASGIRYRTEIYQILGRQRVSAA